VKRSRDLLLEFWDPLDISGKVVAENFKFGTPNGHCRFSRWKCKIRSKGVVKGSRDLL